MNRAPFALSVLAALALVAACSSSPSGSEGPGASSGGEPSAAGSSGGAPSEAPASQGGGGSGSGGIGVTISDGAWGDGSAHVDASGDMNASFDVDLFALSSFTANGETLLVYISSDGTQSVTLAIYADSFAVSVTTADGVGGGGTTTTCDVSYSDTSDDSIAGEYDCPNSPVIMATGTTGGVVDLSGSFSATR